jgi:hypothetical protein
MLNAEQRAEALRLIIDLQHMPMPKGFVVAVTDTIALLRTLAAESEAKAEPVATPIHRIKQWGFCKCCGHDRIPGEGCSRADCPDAPKAEPEPEQEEPLILAVYEGIDGRRQWTNTGTWLYPGDALAQIKWAQKEKT